MKIDCYDINYDSQNGTLFVEALVDDEDGKRVERVPAPFDPYCYIDADSLVMQTLRATGCRIGEGAPDGYLKIVGDHPNDIKTFRERYAFQTYEADVFYDTRVSIDEDVSFSQPDPDQILYFDIEVDDRGQFAQPEDADSRVIAIAAVGGDGEEFYFDRGEEKALLEGFLEAADDYVAMVGWNSLDYDFRYLKNRCAGLGMTVHWDRWVLHDLMPLYDMLAIPTKTVSTKLDDTGEREVGAGKTGVKPGDGRLWDLWNDDPETLEEYNLRDAEIVREIDEKYDLIRLLHVICDLCNYPPGGACYLTKHDQVRFAIGQVVDAKLLEVALRKGIPQANKRTYDKPPDFPGGYVLEPQPGMYEWLVAPDYSGMYPNIVRAWNFGRETYVKPEHCADVGGDVGWVASGGAWEGHRIIKGETGGFVHPDDGPRSVPAEAADELVELRDGAADIVDKGVKAVNNCYLPETAILTPDRGRVPVKDLEVGDRVYSINPETMECEVKPVVATVAEPNNYGELVSIDCQAADLKVTPNHNMLVKNRRRNDAEFEFHDAEELEASRWSFPDHEPVDGRKPETINLLDNYDGAVRLEPRSNAQSFRTGCHMCDWDYDKHKCQYKVKVEDFIEHEERIRELAIPVGVQAAPKHSTNPFEYDTGDMLELMGWYISEGSAVVERGRVSISQQEDEQARLTSLLDDMNITYSSNWQSVHFSDQNLVEWLAGECGRGSGNKRIPDWVFGLDHTLLERLHESLMLGDGSDTSSSAPVYVTTSKELRESFGRLLLHLGETPRFKTREARQNGHSDCYEIRPNSARFVDSADHVNREDHDGMVYCVSVADNHTVLAGRNGVMQWTGQTLYGVFAADHQRYFGPHSENITLVGQELTGTVERIANEGHPDIEQVVYGDTDSVMIDMAVDDDVTVDEAIEVGKRISADIEAEMQEWADGRGALSQFLTLDVDDIYDRFYIGDKKKRYFGHRVFDGAPCDNFKVRGFETRQGNWPQPVRDFQEDLMHALLDEEPTGPIISEAKDKLFSGAWDMEMATSTKLGQPVDEYDPPMPHSRAAKQIRSHHGQSAIQVGDKVDYVKYAKGGDQIAWIYDGEIGISFRPNEGYCTECEKVVRSEEHEHDTEEYPHFRSEHYSYLWDKKFKSVMESIGVSEGTQSGLGDFL